ncbi:efflux RND transporter periplasmic adaptor subunit [Adhaeribacter rhizoryzae]|uniref:Efflux RND transporter periplasmic adaptor subunit n=1 Tax=Adhaeribacter rhizoryzae TaxID=2607907 RepID=A0A5M6D5Z0_9BACT|nr:efflux RND transporter periplasmic adaptor subunit [Adhaeribacter rhizoryzae]KAA5542927.1 efflux RND transporter periplasmic adaptor subunit [Adhaeribacter rhizoryzae]
MKNLIKYTRHGGKLVVAGSFLLLHSSSACHTADSKSEQQVQVTEPEVEVITLQKGKLSSSLQIPGELLPYQEVDLYAKENSYVRKLYVDIGSEVKAGQILASLEAPELNSRLAETQSRLKSQEALYTASRAHYNRLYETSKTPGTISPNDLDQALAKQNSDRANLEAAKAAYRAVVATRNYLEIRAPFNGVITSRNVSPGAYVGPSGKGSELPLLELQEQKKLRLVVSVPEMYTGLLNHQHAISFTVKSVPNQEFKAVVKRMAGALDTRLRAERLEMDVANPDHKLLPGMYAEVNIPLPAKDSTFVVPASAVVASTEKVFVVKVANNKAEWVEVQKGRQADDKVEIYGKLNPGDKLVAVATDEIRDGAELKNIKVNAQTKL